MKKIFIFCLVLSVFLTGCDYFRNHYLKYYPIFPTNEQYENCFGEEYNSTVEDDQHEDPSEENFNSYFAAYKSVGWGYYKEGGESFLEDFAANLQLAMGDSIEDLFKSDQMWIGDFEQEYLLEENEHYSLYYLDTIPDLENHTYSLYGILYYENFKVYYYSWNYSHHYQAIENHLEETKESLEKLYHLIDENRIAANL